MASDVDLDNEQARSAQTCAESKKAKRYYP